MICEFIATPIGSAGFDDNEYNQMDDYDLGFERTITVEHLQPLRLVNKAFAAAAAPFLMKGIYLAATPFSIQKLTSIAKDAAFSKYVKTLYLYVLSFICIEGIFMLLGASPI